MAYSGNSQLGWVAHEEVRLMLSYPRLQVWGRHWEAIEGDGERKGGIRAGL